MSEKKETCDLCGLAVEVDSFKLVTAEGEKKFCCEGCKGIFQMLHGEQPVSGSSDEE